MTGNSLLLDRKWFVTSSDDDITAHYDLSQEIGSGGYGRVLLGTHKSSGETRAVKIIQKSRVKDYLTFQTEIEIMKKLDHPHIVRIIETYETEKICCLVMEYCEGGELFQVVCDKKTLSESEAAGYMRQLLSALAYCHSSKVCHRDLKPENILLSFNSGSPDLKLADFGLAQSFTEEEVMHSFSGTPYYIAPEMLSGSYNHLVDCWSVGVILYIMLSGVPPFNGSNNEEILLKVYAASYNFRPFPFASVSDGAKDLIARLLMKDPELRISAQQALTHPWVRGIDSFITAPLMDEVFEGIKKFVEGQALKKATLMYLASRLAEREIIELKQIFLTMDTDGNGLISYSEFEYGLSSLEGNKSNIKKVYNLVDSNFNGKIDYTEFLAACLYSQKYLNINLIKEAFSYFDTDRSGYITRDELQQSLSGGQTISPAIALVVDEIIRTVDTNGDGKIDYMEYLVMMLEHHHSLL
mmetsp:Transcript_28650/g.50961  ORF Transcript_28650/g.50961 Transcript_28650/m.50961 type:complete len:468 (-) Transcript_28650:1097-2500(-)